MNNENIKKQYKEYGWSNIKKTMAHSFIYPELKKVLKLCNGKILDMGCGNGAIANALINEGYDVYGVDASKRGIEIANSVNPGHFFAMDFDAGVIPAGLQGKKFNVVISTEVIEHLYAPKDFILACRQFLEGGGILILTTPYHGYLKNLCLSIAGKWDKHFTVLWDGGHIKFWSKKTLSILLQENGFVVKKFRGCGRIPLLWKSMMLVAELQIINNN